MKKINNVSLILMIVFSIVLAYVLIGCVFENNDYSVRLEKIRFYLDNEQIIFHNLDELRVRMNKKDIKKTEVIISFDIDLFENTAEGKALREEERYFDITTTHAVIDDWIWRWRTGSFLHYNTMANNILIEINFSSKILLANLTPWAILTAECPDVLYKDILAFSKNDKVLSVTVYVRNCETDVGDRSLSFTNMSG